MTLALIILTSAIFGAITALAISKAIRRKA